jgi:hypothetical protein
MEKTLEKQQIDEERTKIYSLPETQNLLRKLINTCDTAQIVPIYDPNLGFIYKIVEQAFEKESSPEQITDFLNKLAKLDILKREFFEMVAACPKCESTTLTSHYYCPKCKDNNIIKTSLTEHIICGYIDERIKFKSGKCPRCGETLEDDNYRNMGRWYLCRNCEEKTVKPGLKFHCRKCNKEFSIEESKLLEISKFSLNPKRKTEIKNRVASFETISKMLKELGFVVELPGVITGQKSEMKQYFTLVARKMVEDEEFVITLDHKVKETEIKSSEVILYVYKTSEVKVDLPIFIGINQVSEEAKKIANGHQILLLEGSPESKEIIERIKTEVDLNISNRKTRHLEVNSDTLPKTNKKKAAYKSEIKPELFNTVKGIHQAENTGKTKRFRRFMKSLKRD